jgi:hypothetical protein
LGTATIIIPTDSDAIKAINQFYQQNQNNNQSQKNNIDINPSEVCVY